MSFWFLVDSCLIHNRTTSSFLYVYMCWTIYLFLTHLRSSLTMLSSFETPKIIWEIENSVVVFPFNVNDTFPLFVSLRHVRQVVKIITSRNSIHVHVCRQMHANRRIFVKWNCYFSQWSNEENVEMLWVPYLAYEIAWHSLNDKHWEQINFTKNMHKYWCFTKNSLSPTNTVYKLCYKSH